MLQQEFWQRSNIIHRGGVYLGENLTWTINLDFITQIVSLKKGAQALI